MGCATCGAHPAVNPPGQEMTEHHTVRVHDLEAELVALKTTNVAQINENKRLSEKVTELLEEGVLMMAAAEARTEAQLAASELMTAFHKTTMAEMTDETNTLNQELALCSETKEGLRSELEKSKHALTQCRDSTTQINRELQISAQHHEEDTQENFALQIELDECREMYEESQAFYLSVSVRIPFVFHRNGCKSKASTATKCNSLRDIPWKYRPCKMCCADL
jgi:hypothetical protein